jgi:hypothetical protein
LKDRREGGLSILGARKTRPIVWRRPCAGIMLPLPVKRLDPLAIMVEAHPMDGRPFPMFNLLRLVPALVLFVAFYVVTQILSFRCCGPGLLQD